MHAGGIRFRLRGQGHNLRNPRLRTSQTARASRSYRPLKSPKLSLRPPPNVLRRRRDAVWHPRPQAFLSIGFPVDPTCGVLSGNFRWCPEVPGSIKQLTTPRPGNQLDGEWLRLQCEQTSPSGSSAAPSESVDVTRTCSSSRKVRDWPYRCQCPPARVESSASSPKPVRAKSEVMCSSDSVLVSASRNGHCAVQPDQFQIEVRHFE